MEFTAWGGGAVAEVKRWTGPEPRQGCGDGEEGPGLRTVSKAESIDAEGRACYRSFCGFWALNVGTQKEEV